MGVAEREKAMASDMNDKVDAEILEKVQAILAESARQPGIKEFIALMNLSIEVNYVQRIQGQMEPEPVVSQTAGLHYLGS